MNSVYYFIYGPLVEGGYSHSLLPVGAEKIMDVFFPYKLYQTPFGYPAMTNEKGITIGELYSIPSDSVATIDSYVGYYGKNSNNSYFNKMKGTFKSKEVFFYFASSELEQTVKNYGLEISNGDWLSYYDSQWKPLTFNHEITPEIDQDTILEVCSDLGVSTIDEVNVLLESAYRRNIILEAEDRKKKDNPLEKPTLDDLNEKEDNEESNVLNVEEDDTPNESEPTLDDLTEPVEDIDSEQTPNDSQEEKPEISPSSGNVEPKPNEPAVPPPQPPEIPSKKQLDPIERKESPETSMDWKRDKHLRTLYNNFFKVFPSRGSSTKVSIKFTTVKADALHPDNKYLQANITSICSSENVDNKEHLSKFYGQWIQLRRQRNTQQWSVDLPCEVRCECKSFIYYLAYANIRNKSLAGTAVRKGTKDGKKIDYTIPSNKNNPNYIPALCKHLVGLTNELFNISGDGKVKKNIIV